jgi:hypothetical protein
MVTGTMSQYKNPKGTSGSWMAAILQGGVALIKNLVSVILLSITSIFFLWVNGKQSEYDDLEDKPKH